MKYLKINQIDQFIQSLMSSNTTTPTMVLHQLKYGKKREAPIPLTKNDTIVDERFLMFTHNTIKQYYWMKYSFKNSSNQESAGINNVFFGHHANSPKQLVDKSNVELIFSIQQEHYRTIFNHLLYVIFQNEMDGFLASESYYSTDSVRLYLRHLEDVETIFSYFDICNLHALLNNPLEFLPNYYNIGWVEGKMQGRYYDYLSQLLAAFIQIYQTNNNEINLIDFLHFLENEYSHYVQSQHISIPNDIQKEVVKTLKTAVQYPIKRSF